MRRPNKEVTMTNQEMREIAKNVELFKMNYKAGVRLPDEKKAK